jgi:two-component system chemotaxis response regulator CheB
VNDIQDSVPAMQKIRVLVVDDSVLARRMISRIFEDDPAIELVGSACDGLDALKKIELLRPNVVTLDVTMPQLDGMGALCEIVKLHPSVRVVMLSSLTEQGSKVTMDALMNGASDYVSKPASGSNGASEQLATELLSKVKQFFHRSPGAARSVSSATAPKKPSPATHPVEICAIGVSTGGPGALMEALPMIPKDFPVPIVIVQHMPPVFTLTLAKRLNGACRIPVTEAEEGMVLKPGHAVVAPGDFHVRVVRSGRDLVVRLDQGPRECSCRPAVDVLFRSIAENLNGRAIAAVLTGMGQDGLAGARLLKALGATILTQDQASSVVWGMPGAIVAANLASAVLPIGKIVPEILERINY